MAIASGAIYTEGPMQSMDYAEPYLRGILGFIGITAITSCRIEGTMMPDKAASAWDKALGAVNDTKF